MSYIDALERRFGKFAVSNLTQYLIAGQVIAFVVTYANPGLANMLPLSGNSLSDGQWWRLITFVFTPITRSLLFAAFTWYIYYLYGSALEQKWGSFRYTVYLLIAYGASIISALLFPQQSIGSGYMYTSLFLAFAYLYPDFQLLLFFIIPVKVKWLGILAWVGIGSIIILGPMSSKILALLSVVNFFLFFGRDFFGSRRIGVTKMIPLEKTEKGVKNTCVVCGKQEVDHPDLEFRYCSDCQPPACYCTEHLDNHRHRKNTKR